MTIQPIETRFDGILFRSRTEARWALFFKTLGLAYQYESEGYDIEGTWYLPDFYIPEWESFIEVKPYGYPDEQALKLAAGLEHLTGRRVAIFAGNPGPRKYHAWVKWFSGDWEPFSLGTCRRCDGIWIYAEHFGWGAFGGEDATCPSDKHPITDDDGQVGAAMAAAAASRFAKEK